MPKLLPCPQRPDLERFLLGQLPEGDSEHLQRHLAECPVCVNTLHGLEAGDTLVDALRAQASAPPRSEEAVIESLMGRLSGLQPPGVGDAVDTTVDHLPPPAR